ncbi:hypothetical protein BZA05DRAFT_455830 [Tricharina praecox]|uniref:uncharacterized protein n=1 Tax=Tricharina praecox TaxID=43433 RepID=UPI00221F13A5|nr:uncharacterized protein BZA05DRAFT_455830 [Tricharina praecox]KAI5848413.1 hypothetical protein BZA05DRAFT_455830 [Tricharina praecox]
MSSIAGSASQSGSLWRAARKDPEIYGMAFLVLSTFSVFGYYFGRHSTAQMRMGEERINIAENTAPWSEGAPVENSDRNNFKYMYHPGGDIRNAPKKAPSALNAVIVPAVTLPKSLHERFNKYGKDNY